tara:strand:- start:495 stop:650 length:156 start_codon:yes stop_codon:yes gene_type:complete
MTNFRIFVSNKYYERKKEIFAWEQRVAQMSIEEYVSQQKWFLKRMFMMESI